MRLSRREIDTLDFAHISMPGALICQRCRGDWPCTVRQLLATVADMRGEIAELLAKSDAAAMVEHMVSRKIDEMAQELEQLRKEVAEKQS